MFNPNAYIELRTPEFNASPRVWCHYWQAVSASAHIAQCPIHASEWVE
jgi:hypothetical protein